MSKDDPTLPNFLSNQTGQIIEFDAFYNGSHIIVTDRPTISILSKHGNFGTLEPYPSNMPVVDNEEDDEPLNKRLFLYLMPEEALFLLHINCLRLTNSSDHNLDLIQAWKHFTMLNDLFIQNYIIYHYYESRKWTVKVGIKFGGDFVMYKGDPNKYHSSYVILIDVEEGDFNDKRLKSRRSMELPNLLGINRVAEASNKEVIIAKIKCPEKTAVNLDDPSCICQFEIEEILLSRLQDSEN